MRAEEWPGLRNAVCIIDLATGDNERLGCRAFKLWKEKHELDPSQCVQLAIQQLEGERQAEIRAGTAFDCPQSFYAARVIRDKRDYCLGYKPNILSRNVTKYCLGCEHHLSEQDEKHHPKA